MKNTKLDGGKIQGKLILKGENCCKEQIREKNKREKSREEKKHSSVERLWHVCQSMAQEDTSSCQAIHGELHLQQKEIEGSILQELCLGTAKVQQELKVIFTKTMEGFGEQTGTTSGKGLVLHRL